MKKWYNYMLAVLLSGLFIWIGAGGVFVTYHCLNCHTEKAEVKAHTSCCSELQECDHSPSSACHHCHDEEKASSPLAMNENDGTHHSHQDGHCMYVVKYILDIQQNISKVFIPSFDLFKCNLFTFFVPQESKTTDKYYTSFTPPWRPANTVLSSLCVFLI